MIKIVILFITGLILICLGGDRLVDAAVAIAKKMGIPQIVVGATIVSIGTTLPEVLVSTTAAFDGSAAVATGNAFGSIHQRRSGRPRSDGGVSFSLPCCLR